LLDTLLGTDPSLQLLKVLLRKRPPGNPLFLEEGVRTLVETERVAAANAVAYELVQAVGTIEVPRTVQAIWRLVLTVCRQNQKRLLKRRPWIGKDFQFSLLEAIADESDDTLRLTLDRLKPTEFYMRQHSFRTSNNLQHALTHEVTTALSSRTGRKALHARIVGTIERLYPDRLIEHVERLAHHAVRGEMWSNAVTYLRQAGAKALARSANREAVSCFEQAADRPAASAR